MFVGDFGDTLRLFVISLNIIVKLRLFGSLYLISGQARGAFVLYSFQIVFICARSVASVGKDTFKMYPVTEYGIHARVNVICNVFRYITQSECCILNNWITSTMNCIL